MKIIKLINNNVVCCLGENNKEIVVMGRGIGFQKKEGDEIEDSRIEKYFSMPNSNKSQFEELVKEIPYEYIKVADEIIVYAKRSLNRKLNKNIYITLTDHMNYAMERQKQGIEFKNALLWEIKKFYKEEFQIGVNALQIIKKRIGVELPEDEAASLALHIVNAEMDGDIRQSMKIPGIIKDILNIVKYTYKIEYLDESNLFYDRFVTHLKFLLERAICNNCYKVEDDGLCEDIKEKYPSAYEGAQRIKDYMFKKLQYDVSEEEVMYLTIHIARIIRNKSE